MLLETDEHALAYAVMRDVAAATVQPELALRGAPRHVHALRGIDLGRDRRIRLVTRALRHPHPATAALESALAAAARGSCARRDVAGRYIGGRSQPRRAERLPSPRWTRSARER